MTGPILPRPGRRRAAVALLGLAAALTGCSASVHVGSQPGLSKSDVESQVAAELAAKVEQPTPDVTCPSGLPAQVGAAIDCMLTPQGSPNTYSVHVVATAVDGDNVKFSAVVGQTPIDS